jgi:hypothetical protein
VGEDESPFAAIWAFTPPAGGIFPALKPGQVNPLREIYASGLRNSMALAMHPQFPDEGFPFLQGENARDLTDPMKPHEELNVLEKDRHYGWPYCYDLTTPSPEYVAFMRTRTRYQNLCTNTAWYRQPHSLMPPHPRRSRCSITRETSSWNSRASWSSACMARNRPAAARSSMTSMPKDSRSSALPRCSSA